MRKRMRRSSVFNAFTSVVLAACLLGLTTVAAR